MKLVVEQQRRHHGFVQVGDRAAEHVLGAGAGVADFLEQDARKRRRSGVRRSVLGCVSVPYGTVELAQDAVRLRGDIADLLREQRGCLDDALEHVGIDGLPQLRCLAIERMLNRHHGVAVPFRPAIALVRLRGAADGDVFHRAELHDLVFRIQDRGQLGADRNVERIRAGDDRARSVQNGHHGPIVLVDQIGEYQFRLVLESEAKAQHAQHPPAIVGDTESVDQRRPLVGNEVAHTKALHISGPCFDGLADHRVGARDRRRRVVQASEHAALRIEQNDVGIDRVFADIFVKSPAQGGKRVVAVVGVAIVAQEGADVLVARQKADIDGSLEQISHQDVDGDLRLGAGFLDAFLARLFSQLIEQARRELAEGAARAAHVGTGARQLAEQAQIVPDRLKMLQHAAVFFRNRHVRNDPLQIRLQIDAFEFVGHRNPRRRNMALQLLW